jgi:predicted RNase H-like HicB family nuclease
MRYIALVDGNAGAYGVVLPDLPGCTSAGPTTDEALRNAVEAVRLWVEDAIDDGEALPAPRSAEVPSTRSRAQSPARSRRLIYSLRLRTSRRSGVPRSERRPDSGRRCWNAWSITRCPGLASATAVAMPGPASALQLLVS